MKKSAGFTLIELAVTLVVVGIIMVPSVAAYNFWIQEEKRLGTEERLDTIKRAIDVFISQNRVLPCPAPNNVTMTDPKFGAEALPCWNFMLWPPPPGVINVNGVNHAPPLNPHTIRIGDVPVRALGLPDEYIADEYGRRFIYAMTRELAQNPVAFRNGVGAISLVDNNGNSLITPPGQAMFVVASVGPDGLGGKTLVNAVQSAACATAAPATADSENCDNDNAFSVTSNYALAPGAQHFDDFVRYEIKDFVPISSIKEYSVIDLQCGPPGAAPGFVDTDLLANPNSPPEQCASGSFNGDDIFINPTATPITCCGGTISNENPSDGLQIYSGTFISKTKGRLIIRATIPVSVNNALIDPPRWEDAIHAAIYINGILRGHTVILDPMGQVKISEQGYSALVLASDPNLTENAPYTVDIYIYSLGNQGLGPSGAAIASGLNKTGTAGTMKYYYHDAVAKMEIMEIQDF